MKKKLLIAVLISISTLVFSQDIIKTINVVGTGEISLKPDSVIISTGVDSINEQISGAIDINTKDVSRIISGLINLGIKEEDIQTSNYYVYSFNDDNDKDKIKYRVSNSITVTIPNIDNLDKILDELIKLGANKINGVNFTINNPDQYNKELTKLALENARANAEYIASLEGMKISSVLSITEQGAVNNPIMYSNAKFAMEASTSRFSTGSETLNKSYSVCYIIEPIDY